MPHYVYILLCQDGSYYTGYTKNLDLRLRLHQRGKGARYTRIHRPKKLVYVEECKSVAEAMKREKGIKRLNHRQKAKLINLQTRSKRQRKKRRDTRSPHM